MKTCLRFVLLALSLFSLASCNRVLVHGRDKAMQPVTQQYSTSVTDAYKAVKEVVQHMGYSLDKDEESQAHLRTRWQGTKAGSHYINLFDRRDYGTIGAYYRLQVYVKNIEGKAEISVSTETRSLITGRLQSSYTEEKKILKKVADVLRKEDFEMTNVGNSE